MDLHYYNAGRAVMKHLREKTAKSKIEELTNQILIRFAGLLASAKSQGIETLRFIDVDLDELTDPDVYHDAATAMFLAGSIATLKHGEELCILLWERARLLVNKHWPDIEEKVTMQ